VHAEALRSSRAVIVNVDYPLGLAAYNILREVAVEGAKTYFDTNTSNHYHFFCEVSGLLMDIATGAIRIEGLPEAPDGMTISRVDVLVRVVDKRSR